MRGLHVGTVGPGRAGVQVRTQRRAWQIHVGSGVQSRL